MKKYRGQAANLEIMEVWYLRLQVFSGVIRAILPNKEFMSEYFQLFTVYMERGYEV